MTPSKQRNDVRNFLDLLLEFGLAVWTKPVIVKTFTNGAARVSWPATCDFRGDLFRRDCSTVDSFCDWLDAQEFSAILFDGAMLQITFDFFGNELMGHRLGYYPCPFELDDDGRQLLREQPIRDVIDMYRDRWEDFCRLRTPVRFDYDPSAAAEDHPASHITLNGEACRLPVRGPLSLGHFVDFVFRNFYREQWTTYEFLRRQHRQDADRTITTQEECMIHLNWRSELASAGVSPG
jgi:hypothetical protein